MKVCHSTSFTLNLMILNPLPVAARHSQRKRLGNPPVCYELSCRFHIDTTNYPNTNDISPGIDLSRRISTSCHPMSTIANFSSTAVSSTSSSCSPAPSFPASSPTPIRIFEEGNINARMGQIEAYLASDPRREPWVYDVYSFNIRLPPSLMR